MYNLELNNNRKKQALDVSYREFSTILAALRYWQRG